MKVLKGYTKNQYRPEACIVERYIAKEAIEFCLEYINNASLVRVPQSHHDSATQRRGTRGFNVLTMDRQQLSQAHLYVLNNTTEVIPYINCYKKYVSDTHPKINKMRLLQEHNRTFINWFRHTIFVDDNASKTLRLLAAGPNLNVPTWQGYDINAYSFYTKSHDAKSSMKNSGVSVDGQSNHFCSVSNNNPIHMSMPYYGVIEDIWELDYGEFRVHVLRCQWINGNTEVRQDKLGFTLVDLQKGGYNEDPFIMAVQARQVFYVQDPGNSRWSVVLQGRTISISNHIDGSSVDVSEMLGLYQQMPFINGEDQNDVVHENPNDHDEGLWENNYT